MLGHFNRLLPLLEEAFEIAEAAPVKRAAAMIRAGYGDSFDQDILRRLLNNRTHDRAIVKDLAGEQAVRDTAAKYGKKDDVVDAYAASTISTYLRKGAALEKKAKSPGKHKQPGRKKPRVVKSK